jgi:hypothetical protein
VDGPLFRQPNGNVVGSSTYTQVWRAARAVALVPSRLWELPGGLKDVRREAAVKCCGGSRGDAAGTTSAPGLPMTPNRLVS